MATVYVSTSSEFLHEGILNVIGKATELGDVIVGVITDEVVVTYKRMPLLDMGARMAMYSSLKGVTRVVEQRELSYASILRELRPDYVVHGDDWREGVQSRIREECVEVLSEWGGELVEVPYTHGISATQLERELSAFRGSPENRRGSLRRLLHLKKPVRIIEASNGLSGLIVENASFTDSATGQVRAYDGMWVSSLCDSAFKGKPDIELVDFTSRVRTIEEIMEVTTKPIILDGDTGGKAEWFSYNVRTLERLGVSAVIIEDKIGLKQNSLFGTTVEQVQDEPHAFAAKIAAGKKAQRTHDFMIFARIESLIAGRPMADALERADIYLTEGGADGIMIHSTKCDGVEVLEFLRLFRQKWSDVPVILVPTSYNHLTEEELADAGADIIIHANHLTRAAYVAMRDVASKILECHRSLEADDMILPIKEVLAIIPKD